MGDKTLCIFFVTNNYTPYSGGVVQSIESLVYSLRARGHEVFIITLQFLDDHSNDPEYVIRISSFLRCIYKKNHIALPWRMKYQLEELIKKYKPDIVHMHHPFLLGSCVLGIAKKYGVICIFTYHTMYEKYAHYIPLPLFFTQLLTRYMVQRFCKKVNTIIAPSIAIKNQLFEQDITSPIHVIPSPIRECFTGYSMSILDTKNSQFFNLLLVSRFTPEKNIPFVFEVLKKLPDTITLTLVGYGVDYEKMQLLAFETLGLSRSRVQFIHKPSQNDLLHYYRIADLFLFPSQTDTQGLVLAESMSQGLPVIALDGPGQRDIIVDGANGFIVHTSDQAAEAILILNNNPEQLKQLKEGALATAPSYYSYVIAEKLEKLYKESFSI